MSAALIRDVLDSLPTQLAILDDEGVIQYTNRAWQTFGRDNDITGDPEMLGENYLGVCDGSDDADANAVADGIRDVLAGERDEFAHEYPCHSPDELRWFLMRAVPFESEGGRYVLVMHLDITERKLAELSVQEQNEQLDLLSGMLAHDLRNPLAVAMARTQMLEQAGVDVDSVLESLERMDEIIDDALMLARETTVDELETVSLDAVAREAWATIDTKGATLEIESTVQLGADRSLLAQLLENLFRNAVQHAGDTADLTVTVGASEERFFVADDGPGIPPEERESVLEPGHTTHEEGTGLGLSIVVRIAEAHDWSVEVTESESGGAQFDVTGVQRRVDA